MKLRPSRTRSCPASWRTLALCAALLSLGCASTDARYRRIAFPQKQPLPLHESLWAEHTGQGATLTKRHAADREWVSLRAHFESQIYLTYCGVASAVIALKSVGLKGPGLSQKEFFVPAAERVRSQQSVFYGGMSLAELGGLLRAHGGQARVVHAATSSVEAFRAEARANLARSGDVMLVNYLRSAIAQRSGGHISPVGAYDEQTDRMLIMDVSTYKYPPVWVQTATLFAAMNTVDKGAGASRGWVHVSKRGPRSRASEGDKS